MTSSVSPVVSSGFQSLGLIPALLQAVAREGYTEPTPIQTQAIPHVLQGRDLLGVAQTGTGKTAAFLLPILQQLSARPSTGAIRALVLSPTRELAAQIGDCAAVYGAGCNIRHMVMFGGVGQAKQEHGLRRGVDLLVATPGRLLDLMQQGFVRLDQVEHFVLDEADRMLDMGFVHDVRRVVQKLPKNRQTLLFSATIPGAIAELAQTILRDPIQVSVTPKATTAEGIEQGIYFVSKPEKRALLERVVKTTGGHRTIVFTRTKHGANRVCADLERAGVYAAAIHGNKSQGARERALEGFREGSVHVLVATDIAARGIDVDGIALVVNFDLPNIPESYVHRIGRTGRAGATGKAVSFCDSEEKAYLRDIERLIRMRIPVLGGAPGAGDSLPAEASPSNGPRPQQAPRPQHNGSRPQHSGGRPPQSGSRPQQNGPRFSESGPRPAINAPRFADSGPRPAQGVGAAGAATSGGANGQASATPANDLRPRRTRRYRSARVG